MRRWWSRRAERRRSPSLTAVELLRATESDEALFGRKTGPPPKDAAHLRDWFDRLVEHPRDSDARSVVVELVSAAPTRWLRRIDQHMRERAIYYRPTGRALEPGQVRAVAGEGPDRWHLLGLMSMVRSGFVRQAAVEQLASGPVEVVLRYVLLRSDDWVEPVQDRALSSVQRFMAESQPEQVLTALPALWERLEGREAPGRAVEVIGDLNRWLAAPERRDALARAASADDRWLRRLAVRTLLQLEPPTVVLQAARIDDDLWVAARVVGAYLKSPAPDRDTVVSLLASPFAPVREGAAYWVLNKDPNGPDDGLIEDLMTDRSSAVRHQAQAYLRRSGADPADWYRTRDPIQSPGMLQGLADVGGDQDEALALSALDSDFARARSAAVRLLARSTSDTATDVLVRTVGDPTPGLGRPAALALQRRSVSDVHVRDLVAFGGAGDEPVARNVRRALIDLPRWPRLVAALRLSALQGPAQEQGLRLLHAVVTQWERAASSPKPSELEEAAQLLADTEGLPEAIRAEVAGMLDRATKSA